MDQEFGGDCWSMGSLVGLVGIGEYASIPPSLWSGHSLQTREMSGTDYSALLGNIDHM